MSHFGNSLFLSNATEAEAVAGSLSSYNYVVVRVNASCEELTKQDTWLTREDFRAVETKISPHKRSGVTNRIWGRLERNYRIYTDAKGRLDNKDDDWSEDRLNLYESLARPYRKYEGLFDKQRRLSLTALQALFENGSLTSMYQVGKSSLKLVEAIINERTPRQIPDN